jgi:predicted aldo/keto reductase-like oxidoreductase
VLLAKAAQLKSDPPCPSESGLDIPQIFRLYDSIHRHGKDSEVLLLFVTVGRGRAGRLTSCTRCPMCVPS